MALKATYAIDLEAISGEAWLEIAHTITCAVKHATDADGPGMNDQTETELLNVRNTIEAHFQKRTAGIAPEQVAPAKVEKESSWLDE